MASNSNLIAARVAKNDEFYTHLTDIEKELENYWDQLREKVVLCNCDDPTWSNFWRYFHLYFSSIGLKKLIATYYEPKKTAYRFEYEGGDDANIGVGVRTEMIQNGDFQSPECVEVLKECDVVVTNPPFSIAPNCFVPLLMKYRKKFLIVGDLNWISKENIFPLIARNKIWLGYNTIKEFSQPDGSIAKFGNKLWFTNLDCKKRHEKLILRKCFTPEEYPTYTNYDAINVKKVNDIPCDYDGFMGVPISFLHSYNPDQFEIIGCPNYMGEYGRNAIGVKRLGEEWLVKYKEQGGTGHYTANMAVPVYFDKYGVARSPFSKIIIKRKR